MRLAVSMTGRMLCGAINAPCENIVVHFVAQLLTCMYG